jgi:hypothetical protein
METMDHTKKEGKRNEIESSAEFDVELLRCVFWPGIVVSHLLLALLLGAATTLPMKRCYFCFSTSKSLASAFFSIFSFCSFFVFPSFGAVALVC